MKQDIHAKLLPVLREVEQKRLRTRSEIRTTWIVSGVIALLGAGMALVTGVTQLYSIPILGALIGFFWVVCQTGAYSRWFKETVLSPLLKAYDPTLVYTLDGCCTQAEFERSGLFRHRIDRYQGEDLVEGRIGRTAVRFSEVVAEYKTESRDGKGKKQTNWTVLFQGLFFIADFNKHFNGTTYVLPDTAEKALGALGRSLQAWVGSHGELVRMEDPEFEKAFVVYSSDPLEARYILSPALMTRILDFCRRHKRTVHLAFVDSSVIMAIPGFMRFLEPVGALRKCMLEPGALDGLIAELDMVVGLVEDLNLNTRIWTKE